ncbi:2Fe-2S iron-sulfur cluster-binding protein [Rhodococcus sp. NPDC127530]|uniref:2Fe-2S iron-sulfur cluster-binding protein n=1 Tax=unclassified Rhodococcus (in: high G+C Gram-positive bacteria) TaxID=192944 RepID=UPI0036382B16
MVQFTCVDPQGVEHSFDGPEGASIMEIATGSGVDGIVAECGGFMSCATCHVYVDESWVDVVGTAESKEDDTENELLEGVLDERRRGSRLSCQINLTPELDGLRVIVPKIQA